MKGIIPSGEDGDGFKLEVLWKSDSSGFAVFFIKNTGKRVMRVQSPKTSEGMVYIVQSDQKKKKIQKMKTPVRLVAHRSLVRSKALIKVLKSLKKSGFSVNFRRSPKKRKVTTIYAAKGFQKIAKKIASHIPGKVVTKRLYWNASHCVVVLLAHQLKK